MLEKAKGEEGLTREQIESRIVVPHHTIFLQFFSLVYPAGYLYCCRLCILFSACNQLHQGCTERPLSSTHIMLLIIYPMTAEQ
ncbi:YniB family protein [Escherichia coli]